MRSLHAYLVSGSQSRATLWYDDYKNMMSMGTKNAVRHISPSPSHRATAGLRIGAISLRTLLQAGDEHDKALLSFLGSFNFLGLSTSKLQETTLNKVIPSSDQEKEKLRKRGFLPNGKPRPSAVRDYPEGCTHVQSIMRNLFENSNTMIMEALEPSNQITINKLEARQTTRMRVIIDPTKLGIINEKLKAACRDYVSPKETQLIV
ncbi:hypothetical protein GOP47_0007038 [Adiantum capillus-veneris]|uniref:Uncharacterized protein n=1 Tax=Adiantum capillus-veneris TaxID=13818 RepID=A0A9D4ZIX4_ADICA|nr:hypothetical protein GOP47_0007038 [Adiantum capillus-veneris]